MSEEQVQIYDLMACNVYMDFDTQLPKEQHKFLIAFHPTGGRPVPELIESITAKGPNGYQVEVANQEFKASNLNGWIYDRTTDSHWYMVHLYTGFMAPGEYSIKVVTKGGHTCSMSSTQSNESTQAMMAAYLEHRATLQESYTPGHNIQLPADTNLAQVQVDCRSFKALSGLDAYYVFRLCEAEDNKAFDTQNLYWWDNIFLERMLNPDAGKNRSSLNIGRELKPNSAFTYFTELTDSNAMGETNICIFQPHQTFYT